jgi:hypothetical protein
MVLSDGEWLIKFAKGSGYIFSFIIFTIILFYIFKLTNKLPENWGYFYFFLIGMTITLVGKILKMTLK